MEHKAINEKEEKKRLRDTSDTIGCGEDDFTESEDMGVEEDGPQIISALSFFEELVEGWLQKNGLKVLQQVINKHAVPTMEVDDGKVRKGCVRRNK